MPANPRARIPLATGDGDHRGRAPSRLPRGDRAHGDGLTRRETQVLTYVARGLSTKEIAGVLGVSSKTVDRHRANVMVKLDIHDRVLLTHYAIREGLVSVWRSDAPDRPEQVRVAGGGA